MGGKPPQPPIFFSSKSHHNTLRLTIVRALEGTTGKMGGKPPQPPIFLRYSPFFIKLTKIRKLEESTR